MICKLILSNFRNFANREIKFSDGINVINAENAKGKTNVLEAIVFLSLGKSFKARKEIETIKYEESIASITGITSINTLEVKITNGENGWPKKRLLVNGVPRRLIDFAGNIKTVLFAPQDLELVTDGPSLRRNFLDTVLSLTDREYRRSLGSYEKGVKQRNRLLLRIREEGISRTNLLFWNQLLIKNGNYITEKRKDLIDYVNSLGKCNLEYDSSVISESRLDQYKNEEIMSATTLVGPHRDDFIFLKNQRDLSSYGSRGEQRMEVLWLKLAELSYVEEITKIKPILLLDDIFSELDHMHRKIVMQTFNNHQVIITSADEHNIDQLIIKKEELRIINL